MLFSYGHESICLCSENHQHLCNLKFGHIGEHLCNIPETAHLCQNICYYYYKCKGKCNQYCNLPCNHKGDCICKEPHNHLCKNYCSLFGKSGGCSRDCSLIYEHKGNCFCNAKYHTCIEKCELCLSKDVEMECGHVYNHNEKESFCNKCQKNCELNINIHLCDGQHDCNEKCKIEGCCEIESFIKQEEQTYKSNSGEEIK